MKPLLPNPKPKTDRSKKYLAFVRAKPCVMCGKPSIAHHESGLGDSGGIALKCSDYFGIPLCDAHHKVRGRMGFESFYAHWSIDPHKIIIKYLTEYLQKKDNRINVKRMIIDFLIERIKQCQ